MHRLSFLQIEEIEWMRANTPSLFPWVNQCGDGTEWVARAGSPYAVPELYSVKGTSGNAIAMAQAQLGSYESWLGKSQRFGLTLWPLVGKSPIVAAFSNRTLIEVQFYAPTTPLPAIIRYRRWGRDTKHQ